MSNKKENRLKYLCTISLTISNEGRKHEFFKKKILRNPSYFVKLEN